MDKNSTKHLTTAKTLIENGWEPLPNSKKEFGKTFYSKGEYRATRVTYGPQDWAIYYTASDDTSINPFSNGIFICMTPLYRVIDNVTNLFPYNEKQGNDQ